MYKYIYMFGPHLQWSKIIGLIGLIGQSPSSRNFRRKYWKSHQTSLSTLWWWIWWNTQDRTGLTCTAEVWDLGNTNCCAWRFLCIFSRMQPESWKWQSGAFDMKMRCWGQRWTKCCVYLFIFFPVPAFSPTWTDSQLSILQVSESCYPWG